MNEQTSRVDKRIPTRLRILIVEDDEERSRILRDWLPEDVTPTVAVTAGSAIGVLRRDPGHIYSGVILDYDLQKQVATAEDRMRSGQDVADAVLVHLDREVPILIHSIAVAAVEMAAGLTRGGFEVTRIPMDQLDCKALQDWVESARAAWEAALLEED